MDAKEEASIDVEFSLFGMDIDGSIFVSDSYDLDFDFESSYNFGVCVSSLVVFGLCHLLCDAKLAGQLNDLLHSEHLDSIFALLFYKIILNKLT